MRLQNGIGLAFLCAVMVGCGKSADSRYRGPGNSGLSTQDKSDLANLNQTLTDQDDAIKLAFGDQTTMGYSQKAQQMAALLDQTKNCPNHLYQAPSEDYSSGWTGYEEIAASDDCPIELRKDWEFVRDHDRKIWSFSERFTNKKSEAFQKLDPLTSRVAQGTLAVTGSLSTEEKIEGFIRYSSFEWNGRGHLQVDVRTRQIYQGLGVKGMIGIRVGESHKNMIVGTVQWTDPNQPRFYLNYQSIDQKEFLSYFSAFHVFEIMAISQKMR